MKKFIALILLYFVRMTLWFRYRVTIKGFENLNAETLSKPGGVLFLPNHPTIFVDPTLVTLAVWRKYPIRPMIVEYMYYTPGIRWMMDFMNALPVPNFVTTSNSLKEKKAEQVFETVIEGLKAGENFLIYPAGKVKHQAREIIGSSGVHRVIQSAPEANVVLIRTTGLWGSSFSRALTGQSPYMFATMWKGVKIALKNLLFFTPRRHVTIEFELAGPDFPYQGTRLEMNQYLERWYNRPDGIKPTQEKEPGESLNLVSYSMWKNELPTIKSATQANQSDVKAAKIPQPIQDKVKAKLAEMSSLPVDRINFNLDLGSDLGLDSLDNAELLAFLDENYEVSGFPVGELTTVGQVMAIAAKQQTVTEQVVEEEHVDLSKWKEVRTKEQVRLPEGATLFEVFLNNCQRMGSAIACGDAQAGIVTYAQAKLRVLILAEYIRSLPGEYVGILLPSSSTAYLTILACQLAGKIPLMINWTVGPRHLEAVVSLSKVQVVLSSWAFLDRLENVDFAGLEDKIVMLEDVKRNLSLKDKLKAYYYSKLSTAAILKHFNVEKMDENAAAVLLFTSGTESLPKGVPLSHGNILSNQRAAAEAVCIENVDILLGVLPPFHAFGFTLSGLFPLLCGFKVAYYPDPTNGKGLAKAVEHWKATIICGTPTFLKGMIKNARPKQLKTLRFFITGAEKAPADLFQLIKQLGHGQLLEGYGITECSPVLTINTQGDPKKGVGQACPGVELCVVDIDAHSPLPQGSRGLILARGPNIFAGYLNQNVASPFLAVNGKNWYSTGDLGYLDTEHNLILSGRLKRFVKIGGEMISLTAIEEALQKTVGQQANEEHGAVLAICAKEEAGERTRLFLFTCFKVTTDECNRALREEGFSNLVKIFQVQQVPEIPIMGSGKTNYRALEAHLPSETTLEAVKQ